MEAILRFLRTFEVFIYLALGIGGVIYIYRFVLAWQALQGAAFGLEREIAQTRLNHAASALVVLLTMAVVVFVLVSFVAPTIPGVLLPTPTLNPQASPTTTLLAEGAPAAASTPGGPQVAAPTFDIFESDCVPGQVAINSPRSGDEVSGLVPVTGSANIPNFGFYKFEIKRPNETIWLTIQAGNSPVTNDLLGEWDTTRLSPGEYQLGLVLVDNQAQSLPACIVQVRVARAPEPTPSQ